MRSNLKLATDEEFYSSSEACKILRVSMDTLIDEILGGRIEAEFQVPLGLGGSTIPSVHPVTSEEFRDLINMIRAGRKNREHAEKALVTRLFKSWGLIANKIDASEMFAVATEPEKFIYISESQINFYQAHFSPNGLKKKTGVTKFFPSLPDFKWEKVAMYLSEKTGNIMVHAGGEKQEVSYRDFGMARVSNGEKVPSELWNTFLKLFETSENIIECPPDRQEDAALRQKISSINKILLEYFQIAGKKNRPVKKKDGRFKIAFKCKNS